MPNLKSVITQVPFITLGLSVAAVALYFYAPKDSGNFQYLILNRDWPDELWRLVTGHIVHTDFNHLAWNVAALLILGTIIELRSRCLASISCIVALVSVSTWFSVQSMFAEYAGMSGVLNTTFVVALYILGGGQLLHKSNSGLWLIFFLYLSKNIFEGINGDALFTNTAWQPTPGAHIAGMLGGISLCLLLEILKRRNAKKTSTNTSESN